MQRQVEGERENTDTKILIYSSLQIPSNLPHLGIRCSKKEPHHCTHSCGFVACDNVRLKGHNFENGRVGSRICNLSTRWRWVASFSGKGPGAHRLSCIGPGPQDLSGRCDERRYSYPCLYSIPEHLGRSYCTGYPGSLLMIFLNLFPVLAQWNIIVYVTNSIAHQIIYYYNFLGVGWGWDSPLGTSATNWPIVPAPDGRWARNIWWNENL
jgi:hypothetical protein